MAYTQDDLDDAQHRVTVGEHKIEGQQRIVATLERDDPGNLLIIAQSTLKGFERSLELLRKDRDRIARHLGRARQRRIG